MMIEPQGKTEQELQQADLIALEYDRLSRLIDCKATQSDEAMATCCLTGPIVLHVDQSTGNIVYANPHAAEFFGCTMDGLLGRNIDELEMVDVDSAAGAVTYTQSSIEEQVYRARMRHCKGYLLPARIHKRQMPSGILHYRIEDQSLYQRVAQALQQREDAGYQFQQKLKILNEITITLSQIDLFDTLCYQAVQLGVQRLGFSRLSLWFLDSENQAMVGSFGTDEQGGIRDERGLRWSFAGTYVMDFIAGSRDPFITPDDAPIYDHQSQIIGYGWHITVPMYNGDQFIGIIITDNFLHQQPMKAYEPELLRLYGVTVGHLGALMQARHQLFDLRLEHERAQILNHFITDVGHDFRTPLTIINTSSYLLARVTDPAHKADLAAQIQDHVMYINHMLDDMLRLVSLESDLSLSFTPTDLGVLVREVVQSQRALFDKPLRWELPAGDAVIAPVDAAYLRQALSCIVRNAIQYTPVEGTVAVRLVVYAQAIGIQVRDNGIGIETSQLEKIFRPLYRIDQARSGRSSGLGLAIAQRIVKAHGGEIAVTSTPGAGSNFEIILPTPLP